MDGNLFVPGHYRYFIQKFDNLTRDLILKSFEYAMKVGKIICPRS